MNTKCRHSEQCLISKENCEQKCPVFESNTMETIDIYQFIHYLDTIHHACAELSDCEECFFFEGTCMLQRQPYEYDIPKFKEKWKEIRTNDLHNI